MFVSKTVTIVVENEVAAYTGRQIFEPTQLTGKTMQEDLMATLLRRS